jgi:hypothetical protein
MFPNPMALVEAINTAQAERAMALLLGVGCGELVEVDGVGDSGGGWLVAADGSVSGSAFGGAGFFTAWSVWDEVAGSGQVVERAVP